jgi:hypothetical protein
MYSSTHRWSNEDIGTHFARDGGITPIDVFLNTGTVIRWWHAVKPHAVLLCTTKLYCGCWTSTGFIIFYGVGLFVVLRCGWSSMPSFDCSCHAIRVLVIRSVSKSVGLVYVRNRYNTESVFVLEHTGTPKPAVNAACQTVTYQEESHTTNPTSDHTWGLNIGYRPKYLRSIKSISASMHVFAYMRKLDGRKRELRAQGSWPVLITSRTRNVLAWQIHDAYLFTTRDGMNETCETWMETRRCLLRNFLWHKWTENLMITKCPNTISSEKTDRYLFFFFLIPS